MIDRRTMLLLTGGSLLADVVRSDAQTLVGAGRWKALVFDGFAIFDPRPVGELAELLLPGHGQTLMNAWRARQFEYQWLRALAGRYVDFVQATRDSLAFAIKEQRLDVSNLISRQLLAESLNLRTWPDVRDAIARLQQLDCRLVFLSNITRPLLDAAIVRNGMQGMFDAVISTDSIRSYKPDPRTYRLALDRLQLRRDQILFVAFAGWDVAGAKWFGFPTFWVNRLASPGEELGVEADAAGRDLNALLRFLEVKG